MYETFEPAVTGLAPPRPVILIVDDDPSVRLALEAVVADMGYLVTTASDGVSGLAAFHRCKPTLVLTDIIMPGKDGIELIREIREECPAAKIIAMSGGGRVGDIDFVALAIKLGANAGIQKPFGIEALTEILLALLQAEYASSRKAVA